MGSILIYFSPFQSYSQNSKENSRRQDSEGADGGAILASSSMVPTASKDERHVTNSIRQQKRLTHPSRSTRGDTPPVPQVKTHGLELIRGKYKRQGLRTNVINVLMQSWRVTTKKQYNTYLEKWGGFCEEKKKDPLKRQLSSVRIPYTTV